MPAACSTSDAISTIGDDVVTSLPILVLNVHSRCNCRCLMCDIWKRDTTTEITAADLARHREALRTLGVRWVVLSGGEPLMHSDLGALCGFFRELGIRLTLLTTGILLSRCARQVSESVDDVIVSLDGPADVHDAVRRTTGAFALIQSGVAQLRQLRPELKITARTTVQKANHTRLNDTVHTAEQLGLSGISFLAADLTSEAFNRPLVWPTERQNPIALTVDETVALSEEVEQLIVARGEQIRSGYIAENASKLRRIVSHFRAHLGMERHHAPLCNAPWTSAVIEPDGTVRPCFFHRAIGNIHHASLAEIVNGDDAISFRRSLDMENDFTCQRCVCSLNYRGASFLRTALGDAGEATIASDAEQPSR
jgi:Fe-coproporphyrin III synthase